MKRKEILDLYDTCLKLRTDYHNDYVQQLNNVRFARSDDIDLLALTVARHDSMLVDYITGIFIDYLKLVKGSEL